jgi:NADPH2:quinone reductase
MQSYWMQLGPDGAVLQLRDVPRPQPGAGQLLVRLQAAGLNRGEFILGHGLLGTSGAKPIGMEGAGEVVAVGANAGDWKPGAQVMGRCAGAFSEFALMDVREAMEVPAALSLQEAAAIPLTYQTAYDLVVLQGRLRAGEWLLINGVSSGVGVAAAQIAKHLDAKVIGTSGSADKLARLRPLGIDLGIRSRGADFHEAVMAATGGAGVNLVVNTVGGSVFAESVRCLAFEGRLGMVGYVDGVLKAEIDLQALHARRLTLFGVSNKMRSPEQRAASVPAFSSDLEPAFAAGRIKPVVDRVFPFEQLAEARAYMEANRHVGKIVLAMPGTL